MPGSGFPSSGQHRFDFFEFLPDIVQNRRQRTGSEGFHMLPGAFDGIFFVVQQMPDFQDDLNIPSRVEPLAGRGSMGPYFREFLFPEPNDMRRQTGYPADLADLIIEFIRPNISIRHRDPTTIPDPTVSINPDMSGYFPDNRSLRQLCIKMLNQFI
jgi:hypothetical protein